MTPMWVRYTTLHGPTSFDEDGHWLGQGPGFWGSMMAPTMLLIVLGLYGHRTLLAGNGGRSARIGYQLTMIGLGVPAVLDLTIREVVPPFLMPLAAIGLILLAAAHRHDPALPTTCRVALLALGLLPSFLLPLNPHTSITALPSSQRLFPLSSSCRLPDIRTERLPPAAEAAEQLAQPGQPAGTVASP